MIATATATTARRRLSAIRNALALADDLLAQAYAAEDWRALGHASWAAYCAAELPELRMIKLRAPERRARLAALVAVDPDLSVRDGVAATGASLGTVHGDLAILTGTAAGTGGPGGVAPAPVAKPSGAARVRAALARTGAQGATAPELERKLKLHHGIVSGELSRLARRGLATPPTATRNGHGVYVMVTA